MSSLSGWIIYREDPELIKQETYEVDRLLDTAARYDIDLKVVRPEQVDILLSLENRKSVLLDGAEVALPDFVLPRMGAGTDAHALAVIAHLELLGVWSLNSSVAVEAAADKLHHIAVLAEADLPIPDTMLLQQPFRYDIIESHFGYPCIVKVRAGSQGVGVHLIENSDSLKSLLDGIDMPEQSYNLIVQKFIKSSSGRDLRVIVIGGRAVGAMERIAKEGFKANVSQGGSARPFEVTSEVEWLCLEIAKACDMDIVGVDLLFDDDGFKICEINSSPGFQGMEEYVGVDVPDQIFKYIQIKARQF